MRRFLGLTLNAFIQDRSVLEPHTSKQQHRYYSIIHVVLTHFCIEDLSQMVECIKIVHPFLYHYYFVVQCHIIFLIRHTSKQQHRYCSITNFAERLKIVHLICYYIRRPMQQHFPLYFIFV